MTLIEQSDHSSWWRPVATLAIGTFAFGTDSFVLAGILPQISAGLDVSMAGAGQTVTVFALAYGLAAPFLAASTSHLPRGGVLVSALLLFIGANVVSAIAPTLIVLLAARAVAGVGAALFTPTASAAAVVLAGEAMRGRAMSVVLGGLTLGTVAGVPLGTAIGQSLSWRASLIFVAAVGVVALGGAVSVLSALPTAAPRVPLGRRFAVMARPRVVAMVTYMVVFTAGSFTFYTYAAELLDIGQGMRDTLLSAALCAWGVGGLIGSLGSGWITDRWGPSRSLTITTTVLLLAILVIGLVHSVAVTLVAMVVYGAGGWGASTPNNHRLTSAAPDLAAVAISFNASGIYIGEAIGAMIGGVLIGRQASAPAICMVVAAITVASLVLHLCIPGDGRTSTRYGADDRSVPVAD